jgi:hypothetical protein
MTLTFLIDMKLLKLNVRWGFQCIYLPKIIPSHVRFEVFTAVTMRNGVI